MDTLHILVLDAYDRWIGLELDEFAVDGCMTTASCGGELAGRSPVNRGKQSLKRSLIIDAAGIPLGIITSPASLPNSPLLGLTVDTLGRLGPLPPGSTVHLDRGYDSGATQQRLEDDAVIAVGPGQQRGERDTGGISDQVAVGTGFAAIGPIGPTAWSHFVPRRWRCPDSPGAVLRSLPSRRKLAHGHGLP